MSTRTIFTEYVRALAEVAAPGDAGEESYYSCLADMLKAASRESGRTDLYVTALPKGTEAGNPDFRLWNGTDRIVGYIEAKSPTNENLDAVEASEQLTRYRETFPNLILTNFLEFRLYRQGQRVARVLLGQPYVLTGVHRAPPLQNVDVLWRLLEQFLDFSLAKSTSAEELAGELARRTRLLRDVVAEQLSHEIAGQGDGLDGFYEAFRKFLIADLTPQSFADLYAQTITYGLFVARSRTEKAFSRTNAFDNIPRSIGILRDVFRFISLGDLPQQLEWIVDDIAHVLSITDVHGILSRYYHRGKGSDPIVHFYETFLATYDPQERERRGVYYTPEPVVSYIVRSLHQLLKSEFGLADGLASRSVTLLDPAAGTMTFVARAAREAIDEFQSKYGGGAREEFIVSHILPHFFALELMMAPYAVGHLKMSLLLEELGHRLTDDERVRLYLTNTLEQAELERSRLPGLVSMAEESHLAGEVKSTQKVLVILGNPPYSGHSANRSWEIRDGHRTLTWIGELIEDYKRVDGKPLGEKNPKWLQDDYVKFLRFAQWKIEQNGRGVVAMITNHSYLDNPTFRGMRQSLMGSFDHIFVLDLHGNALKKEVCDDGTPDQNVFDIRQGVAVALFVKNGGRSGTCRVSHAELRGTRDSKYDRLAKESVAETHWQDLRPTSPSYLFVPQDVHLADRYSRFVSVPTIFPVNSVGIVTARDSLTIHWTAEDAWKTVSAFSRLEPELAREAYKLGPDAQDWKVALAQKDLRDSGPSQDKVVPILYRPFDVRYTYYTGRSRGFLCRPRPEVMQHMLRDNVALILPRRVEYSGGWRHALVGETTAEHVAVSLKSIDYVFPLRLRRGPDQRDLFSGLDEGERLNLNQRLVRLLTVAYHTEPAGEDILSYVYGMLFTPTYRSRYTELLTKDFPRIPFTKRSELFAAASTLGQRLVQLHLLRAPELDTPIAHFEGQGDGVVGRGRTAGLRFDEDSCRVYLNAAQYFAPVPAEVWEYQIGGYQVCAKWLKDREGRHLELDDIRTYCRIVTALQRTIELQKELDELYPSIEENLLQLEL